MGADVGGALTLVAALIALGTALAGGRIGWKQWMGVAVVAVVYRRKSFATTAGMLCGAMANPIALGYVNDTVEGDQASLAYAAVYPLAMFLRVIIAQIIVMLWFG